MKEFRDDRYFSSEVRVILIMELLPKIYTKRYRVLARDGIMDEIRESDLIQFYELDDE